MTDVVGDQEPAKDIQQVKLEVKNTYSYQARVKFIRSKLALTIMHL